MTEYQQQAKDFLTDTGTTMKIIRRGSVKGFPFDDHDKLYHDKYNVTLIRGSISYSFPFYDCAARFGSNKYPSEYDILASLEKYPVSPNVWEFAKEFGYTINDEASYKRVENIRRTCEEQYTALENLFCGSMIDKLREIN